ncbi:hypothetical protein P3X46_021004 [Hevea brasiliensis]|uniref:NB-ARC domain-containing protein n=1 Tax=Hevea brasiliensis TaxID=3981 RepID=A0ABQ9LHX6_HEVBR|nr:probable disease resistance protein RF45 [Hevea brasiliensis]KAJ9166223.1 hypothetical protein P3X46_021004 [Hevea brasiliensis]
MALATIPAVHLLMKKLHAILDDKEFNNPRLRKQINNVMEKLKELQTLLTQPEYKQKMDDELETKLLHQVYWAEDIIDIFLIKTALQRRKTFAKMRPLTLLMSVLSQTITRDMKQFVQQIDDLCAIFRKNKPKQSLENEDGDYQGTAQSSISSEYVETTKPASEGHKHPVGTSSSEAKTSVSNEQSVHALEPSSSEAKPDVSNEQSVHALEPSSSEANPSASDEQSVRPPEPSIAEAKPGVSDEQSERASNTSSSEVKPGVSDEQFAHGPEPSSSEVKSGVSNGQSVFASKTSSSEAKPDVLDEQSVRAPGLSSSEVKPGASNGQSVLGPRTSSSEAKPGVSIEEYEHAPEPSSSEAKPGVSNEQSMHAPELSSFETKPGVSNEQSVNAPERSSLETKQGLSNERSVHAPKTSSSEAKPSVSNEQFVNAPEPSNSKAKPRISGEQSTRALEERLSAEQQHAHATELKVAEGKLGAQATDSTKSEEKEASQNLTSFSGHLDDDELDFIGRKDKADELAQALFKSHKLRFLIAVAGAAGSGKTTFIRNIYNKGNIVQHFQLRVWINVSEEFPETVLSSDAEVETKKRNLLIDILKQVTTIKEEERLPLDKLQEKVRDFFIRKRFLIVLDDVKTSLVWDILKNIFPNSLNGSRLILITRDGKMAEELTGLEFPPIKIPNLNVDESWALFLKKVQRKDFNDLSLKQQIWEKCKGLPLAIVVLGGLLSTKDPNSWSRVIGRVSFGDDPSKAILALAYEDLSSDLKPCLLYLSLFPKEYSIPVRRLFRLWAAEGLANPSSKDETPEVLVERYLQQLIKRNMVEVARWRLDGSPKTCRVPGILYDNIFPNATGIGFCHVLRDPICIPTHSMRRIATYGDISNSLDPYIDNLRSYISFNTRKGDTPAVEVEKFLNKIMAKRGFGLITVLDLEKVYKPVLTEAIGKLLHLTYLGLRWTFLDSIPNSVGDLPNLETLDVKHTNITVLPISIWNSKKLRHLYMNEIYLDVSLQKPLAGGSLGNLLTMWGLIIGKRSPGEDWLIRLIGLTKLGLTCHFESLVLITTWISKCTNLRSLKLRSIDEFRRPSDLTLWSMREHKNLWELNLLGKLSMAIDNIEFPQNLKMLTLSVSQLDKDPMKYLGQLRELNILRLFARSYLGKEMTCHAEGFPKLRVLKLWMLVELEKWTLEEGSFPQLRELEIRRCEKLKETSGLNQLKMLKELTLTNMPRDFALQIEGSMKEIQGRNVTIIVRNWDFPALPNDA